MAKGDRGGRRAQSTSVKGSLTIGDDTMEFDGDIVYTDIDKALSAIQRSIIGKWEAKRVKNKIEYAYAVDGDGNILGERKGGKGSVSSPSAWKYGENNIFTHIHPRENGTLGGTFSERDLELWARYPSKTTRAAAKEGTYSISKTSNFNKSGFLQYFSKTHKTREDALSDYMKNVRNNMRGGKITWETYSKEYDRAFNNFLIGLHNDLLAGQKAYGYNYHLEKR